MDALVDTGWLAGEIAKAGASSGPLTTLRVVDTRFYLDPARHGRDAWRAGHIPGAIFLDMDQDLSAPGGGRGLKAGRHPWPSEEQVSRVMGAAGIGPGVRVVAYDDNAGGSAARLWYLLRAHGHDDVAVLDGGLAQWTAEGRPLSSEAPRVEPAPLHGPPAARLRGLEGRDDPRPRAAPRARRARQRALPRRERADRPARRPHPGRAQRALGREPDGRGAADVSDRPTSCASATRRSGPIARSRSSYCGSGVTACHDLLALHLAGLRGTLYAGSWSEWSSDPALPAATGGE